MKFQRNYTEHEREEFEKGLPDYHDPTAGLGGAAPTYSPLSLRLVLAIVALVLCVAAAVLGFVLGLPALAWPMVGVAVLVLVDLGIVVHRKRRGEPG